MMKSIYDVVFTEKQVNFPSEIFKEMLLIAYPKMERYQSDLYHDAVRLHNLWKDIDSIEPLATPLHLFWAVDCSGTDIAKSLSGLGRCNDNTDVYRIGFYRRSDTILLMDIDKLNKENLKWNAEHGTSLVTGIHLGSPTGGRPGDGLEVSHGLAAS